MSKELHNIGNHYYSKPIEEVLSTLDSSLEGLTQEEAELRLEKYGRNELKAKKKKSKLALFLNQFKDFLVIVLIAAAIISAVVGEVIESIVIWLILFANAILGYFQESRAEKAIEALKNMGALTALTKRSRKKIEIPSYLIVPGDIIYLETGDKIPADGRVLKDTNFYVEEAALTGESVPVLKKSQVIQKVDKDVPLAEQSNMVFSSTIVTNGRAKVAITDTGMKTEIGKIANLIQGQKEVETPLNIKLKKFGKQLGIIILIICLIIFVVYIFRGEELLPAFIVTISLAVAAIPEGLPVVVTTTFAIGVVRMAKRNAILRKLPAIETLGSTTTICTDKTGTLTRNQMTIKKIYANHEFIDVSGEGYIPDGNLTKEGKLINIESDESLKTLVLTGYVANNASLVIDDNSQYVIQGDPTEGAFIVLGEKLGLNKKEINKRYDRKVEFFFDSTRKRMSVVVEDNSDTSDKLYMKGAPEIVLNLCNRIYKNGQIQPITEADREKILDANQKMGEKALRVLATAFDFCERENYECLPELVEEDLIFVGLVGMIDPPRSEVKQAISKAKTANIDVIMITGDHAVTAKAIGEELKIIDHKDDKIITGQEIDKLSDSELLGTHLFARVAPEHKLRIVNTLQNSGEIVAMTGDGVNDAPALKKADTGIAMGITGTDVSKEASDMILADDNFATIVNAIEEGRGIYDNMRKFILFLISCNIAEIMLIFIGIMLGLPLPLIAIQILWINLMTDGLPALALSVDPYDDDLMERGPRDPQENIINKRLFVSIVIRGLIITVISLSLYYFALELYAPNWRTLPKDSQDLYLPRTFVFSTLLICEILNVYNCRSERHSIFSISFWSNKWLIIAVSISLILNFVLIYNPLLSSIFQLAPLPWYDWFIIIPLAFLTVLSEEIIKLYWRRCIYPKE
ncbi:MAG: calcium-translocating P-type ATPase, SERCA-type [Candidatus Lokiarchaeota archaeon]|nr:calcium-translocating P-type ATPase, SERCA-type [Candidatus Lokiarchaeota archaeon]MBD3338132.1 calcium-translocating P-type ATPase, SERCA-type [Candidatus Lokiarchaeota archaeon]